MATELGSPPSLGWGGRRDGAGCGRVKTLDPAELRAYARQGMSRARAAQFLGTSWAVVDREARRHGITFPSTRHYGISRSFLARRGHRLNSRAKAPA